MQLLPQLLAAAAVFPKKAHPQLFVHDRILLCNKLARDYHHMSPKISFVGPIVAQADADSYNVTVVAVRFTRSYSR